MTTVLVCSAGRRVGLVEAFREAGAARVVACDLKPDLSAACAVADAAFGVPRVDDAGYAAAVLEIVRAEDVGLVVPTIDPELLPLAEAAGAFAEAGARVHVSDVATIEVVRDKGRTVEVLGAGGVPVPVSLTEAEARRGDGVPWPLFAKPAGGSASRGLARYDSAAEMPAAFPEPMVFQELLEGPEFTVNMFVDADGRLTTVIPHERLSVRAGEVEKGRTVRRGDIREIAEGVARALPGLRGAACFQLIDDARVGPKVFEINARFGGGYPLAHHAGARFAEWLLREVAGGASGAHDDWRAGALMLRYDAAVYAG